MVAEAVKAFEALAPLANPMKRLTRSATGSRKWWRSARSVKKFDFFRQIDSLSEYVLVSQEDSQVECFTRQSDGNWILSISKGLGGALRLSTVSVELPLVEIYDDIVLSAE